MCFVAVFAVCGFHVLCVSLVVRFVLKHVFEGVAFCSLRFDRFAIGLRFAFCRDVVVASYMRVFAVLRF